MGGSLKMKLVVGGWALLSGVCATEVALLLFCKPPFSWSTSQALVARPDLGPVAKLLALLF